MNIDDNSDAPPSGDQTQSTPEQGVPPAAVEGPSESVGEPAPLVEKKKRTFSIGKKISLLILAIVIVSISSYAYFAVWQFKNDKLKYIHVVNSTFTATIGKKIQATLDETIGDMQNIVSLLGLKGIDQERSRFLTVIFQNNVSFVSMSVYRAGGTPSPTPEPPSIDEQPASAKGDSSGVEQTGDESSTAKEDPPPSPAPDSLPPAPSEKDKNFKQHYALFNKDFLSLNRIEEEELKALCVSELERFLEAPKPRANPYFIDSPKMNVLTFVYPLDQQETYFAVFNISKEFLYEAVSDSDVNEPMVTDEKGHVLMHVDKGRVGQFVKDLPIFELAQAAPIREGGMEFTADVNGENRSFVGNFYKMGNGLILITQADKGKAFEGMQKIIFNTILFAFDIVGIAIIIGVLFSKTLTAPLEKLMLVTENIAAGNYNVQSDIKTNDEVGQLADYFVALGKKLDEREAQLEKATELAIKDGMTGVFNHRHFRNRFNEFFALARRHDRELSLILTDIDFFKKFNDTYGHQQGDQVIKDIAKILVESTRNTDFVARYGGEEFVVVLPDTGKEGAVQTAEKIRQNYKNHKIKNLAGEGFLSSTCSLGVATLRGSDFKTIDEFIEHADKNLYTAKKSGRDRVVAD